MKVTCEHCKDKFPFIHGAFIDNAAGAQNLTLDFDITCNNAGCAMPTFCMCECHNIDVTGGAQP